MQTISSMWLNKKNKKKDSWAEWMKLHKNDANYFLRVNYNRRYLYVHKKMEITYLLNFNAKARQTTSWKGRKKKFSLFAAWNNEKKPRLQHPPLLNSIPGVKLEKFSSLLQYTIFFSLLHILFSVKSTLLSFFFLPLFSLIICHRMRLSGAEWDTKKREIFAIMKLIKKFCI